TSPVGSRSSTVGRRPAAGTGVAVASREHLLRPAEARRAVENLRRNAMETVTNMREDSLDGLRDLIRINLDAKKGFEESAKELESDAMRKLFLGCAAERDSQATELRRYVELNDEDASDGGSAKGAIHRAWLKFRAALAGDTDLA